MVFKKSYQWLFYRCLEGIFLVFLGLPRLLPPDIFRRVSMPLLSLLISFLVPRRRIVKNLGAAFGEVYSEASKKGLAKGVHEHFVRNLVECFLQVHRPGYVSEIVGITGEENLVAAL